MRPLGKGLPSTAVGCDMTAMGSNQMKDRAGGIGKVDNDLRPRSLLCII